MLINGNTMFFSNIYFGKPVVLPCKAAGFAGSRDLEKSILPCRVLVAEHTVLAPIYEEPLAARDGSCGVFDDQHEKQWRDISVDAP